MSLCISLIPIGPVTQVRGSNHFGRVRLEKDSSLMEGTRNIRVRTGLLVVGICYDGLDSDEMVWWNLGICWCQDERLSISGSCVLCGNLYMKQ